MNVELLLAFGFWPMAALPMSVIAGVDPQSPQCWFLPMASSQQPIFES